MPRYTNQLEINDHFHLTYREGAAPARGQRRYGYAVYRTARTGEGVAKLSAKPLFSTSCKVDGPIALTEHARLELREFLRKHPEHAVHIVASSTSEAAPLAGPYIAEPASSGNLFGGWWLLRLHADPEDTARTILAQGLHEKEARVMADALNAALNRGEWTLLDFEDK